MFIMIDHSWPEPSASPVLRLVFRCSTIKTKTAFEVHDRSEYMAEPDELRPKPYVVPSVRTPVPKKPKAKDRSNKQTVT